MRTLIHRVLATLTERRESAARHARIVAIMERVHDVAETGLVIR